MTRVWITVLLALLFSSIAWSQGSRADERRKKAVAVKKTAVDAARAKLSMRNRALQKIYRAHLDLYDKAASGQDQTVAADLERALEDAAIAAREILQGGRGDRVKRRAQRAFQKKLKSDIAKLEHDLLKFIPLRIESVASTLFDASTANPDALLPKTFAAAVRLDLFDGSVPFHQLWNDGLCNQFPETQAFADEKKAVVKLENELMVLRDPKLAYVVGAPSGMAKIPTGTYLVEGRFGFKKKRRQARVNEFYMDLYEVSHADYWSKFFVHITDKVLQQARLPRDRDKNPIWIQDPETGAWRPASEILEHPVTGVDCESALAYAKSQDKRLPTEAEWVAAASADTSGRGLYPWGPDYKVKMCNDRTSNVGKTMPVHSHAEGRSLFGVYNMAGNVKEWVSTSETMGKDFVEKIPENSNVVIRGGSFRSNQNEVSTKWRWVLPALFSYEHDVGFRCARSL